MAKRRRYTDEERAQLVTMLEAEGYPDNKYAVSKVAGYAKVPERTLRYWFKHQHDVIPAKLCQSKKRDLATRLEEAISIFLEHAIDQDTVLDMSGAQSMTALGIAFDKLQLIKHQPTERNITTIEVVYKDREQRNSTSAIEDSPQLPAALH